MKKTLLVAGLAVVLGACSSSKNGGEEVMNPFFTEYATPFFENLQPPKNNCQCSRECLFQNRSKLKLNVLNNKGTDLSETA